MADIPHLALEDYLAAVGEHLLAAGQEVAVVVVGGAALNLGGHLARTTEDVDVYARAELAGPHARLLPAHPLPEPLARAVAKVARDFDLPQD